MNDEERVLWGFRPWAANGMTIRQAQKALEAMPGGGLDPVDKMGRPIPNSTAPAPNVTTNSKMRMPIETVTVRARPWPTTGDSTDTIHAYPEESRGSRAAPSKPGLNRFGYQPQQGDVDLLARIIYAEGGLEDEAYPALGWSIVNRIGSSGRPKTLAGVVYEPNQFYAASKDNERWMETQDPSKIARYNRRLWGQARLTAEGILSGQIPDPVRGGTYFYTSDVAEPPRTKNEKDDFFGPAIQGRRIDPTLTIGRHAFLRDAE